MAAIKEKNVNWKGGIITDGRGYVFLLIPKEKRAGKERIYISEHRKIMSEYLKRPLLPNEVVHHINGIKNDNRIENLIVITRANHIKEHTKNGKHPNWRGGKASIKCRYCGKIFLSQEHNRNDVAKYCSYNCYWDSMRAETRTCLKCGKEFQPPNPGKKGAGKYCSRVCFHKRNKEC
jgi:hypothetical protein